MLNKALMTTALALALMTASATAQTLPACSDASVVRDAFLYGFNQTVADLVITVESLPGGADKRFGRKTCRVTYRCNLDKAKKMEAPLRGSHPISRTCFEVNLLADAGNPPWMEFAIEPNGEGGTIITTLRGGGGGFE